MFESESGLRKLARGIKWKRGEYIATLHIPSEAPITYADYV